MSDYHIMSADKNANSFGVVMHFPVPDQLNEAGRNYREVLIEYLGGTQVSRVPFIDGAEQTQLSSGELYEHSFIFNSNPTETLAQKQVRLDSYWEDERVKKVAELSAILSYWGHSRDIP